MDIGIVAGFGHPLGIERLSAISAHGFSLIRQDIQTVMGRTPNVPGVLNEEGLWTVTGGRMLYIVDEATLPHVPRGSWVEFLNEPEYMTPQAYADRLKAVWPLVRDRQLVLWAGGIGNLDRDSLQWLSAMLYYAPYVMQIAVHRYCPDRGQTSSKSHTGFATRAEEVKALRGVIGARAYLVSEVGYHTAWRRKWWIWRTRLSGHEQAMRLVMELDFWRAYGAAAVCVYQENDGPGNTQDKYGMRDETGVWKTSVNFGNGDAR